MKIKFETEVKNCSECPFCYYYSDHHELSGNFCRLRETMGESYAFTNEEKGIHKNCPFIQKGVDNN